VRQGCIVSVRTTKREREAAATQAKIARFAADLPASLEFLLAKHERLRALRESPQWDDMEEHARVLLGHMDDSIIDTLYRLALGCARVAGRIDRFESLVRLKGIE
jgi:hypothetical protein